MESFSCFDWARMERKKARMYHMGSTRPMVSSTVPSITAPWRMERMAKHAAAKAHMMSANRAGPFQRRRRTNTSYMEKERNTAGVMRPSIWYSCLSMGMVPLSS